jgi:type IX secretion system PorP/SprF family membrane protein
MKKQIRILICVLSGLMLADQFLLAQDPRLGQYFASPMTLNPALTGKNVNDWRVLTSYRSQWQGTGTQPYTTATVSVEKNLTGNDKNTLGLGMMFLNDASNGGVLKNNYFAIGLAYNNALDAEAKHFLGGGLTVNYANRILDQSKFLFESQLGSGGYQPSIPANDGVAIPKNSYFDVNAGLSYSYQGNRSGFYTGIGYFHAFSPEDAATNNTPEFSIDPRINVQAGFLHDLGQNGSSLNLSSIWEKQGVYNRFTLGLMCKLALPEASFDIQTVNIGLWDRFGDAIYPYVGIEGRSWLLGFSYDVITSNVSTASLQSFEISFGLQFGKLRKAATKRTAVIQY